MANLSTVDRPRVTFFVRNCTTGVDQQKRRVLERLRALVDDGRVANVEVQSWPAKVEAEDAWSERETGLHDTIRQIEEWAEDADVSIEPFFDTRADTYLATADEGIVRVLPVMAIAVYDGTSALATVAPHMTADGPYTVYDCVADLETGPDDATDTALSDPSLPTG